MNDMTQLKILVTGACGVTSRAVVRSLKKSTHFANARFVGTDICANIYGLTEGLYETIYRVPYVTDASYGETMDTICKREAPDLAVIIPELEVMYWTEHTLKVPCLLPPLEFCRVAGSKKALYEALDGTGLVPSHDIVYRDALLDRSYQPASRWPCWIRDYEVGSTSGRGSLLAQNQDEIHAWVTLNPAINRFMVSEFLSGRNFACHLLYYQGNLIKAGTYERLEYFMARVVPSGVSGNISRGRLLKDPRVLERSRAAVESICTQTGEVMHGLVAVDLREDRDFHPMVTEINLRHVACTSAFADAGHNLVEAQLFATMRMPERAGELEKDYPPGNYILRDIDGPAKWVSKLELPPVGQPVIITP